MLIWIAEWTFCCGQLSTKQGPEHQQQRGTSRHRQHCWGCYGLLSPSLQHSKLYKYKLALGICMATLCGAQRTKVPLCTARTSSSALSSQGRPPADFCCFGSAYLTCYTRNNSFDVRTCTGCQAHQLRSLSCPLQCDNADATISPLRGNEEGWLTQHTCAVTQIIPSASQTYPLSPTTVTGTGGQSTSPDMAPLGLEFQSIVKPWGRNERFAKCHRPVCAKVSNGFSHKNLACKTTSALRKRLLEGPQTIACVYS